LKRIIIITIGLFAFHLIWAQDSARFSSDDLKLYPLLFQQTAAEYRALCYQAFNTARMQLDETLKQNPHRKNLAIITDLDETILDNSEIEAQKIKTGKEINYQQWITWLNKPGLPTVPGGVDFLKYAGSKGVHIFYISNRDVRGVPITLTILQKLRLPNADTSHMFFMSNDFSKESRRQTVMKDYDVVMLLGDNLDDFTQVFESRPINERFAATDSLKNEWGKKFIVLPNASYGEWENALFNYQDEDSLSIEQKIEKLKAVLKDASP
jgi:5'-nucleotidase (lipoprotein e(P4) family)